MATENVVTCRIQQTAPGRPVRVPSSEESGAPGAEPGAVVSLGGGLAPDPTGAPGAGIG